MNREQKIIVRIGGLEYEQLERLLFSRYPHNEWATFLRFGWRESSEALIFTSVGIDPPESGDMDERVGHVKILEPYTVRVALAAESHPFAIGVAHSHPEDYRPHPSGIDDDMDSYYSEYFAGFTHERPYLSLIVSKFDGQIVMSGRVFDKNRCKIVDRFIVERTPVQTWLNTGVGPSVMDHGRTARLTAAFGEEASERLRVATVAVIGAGGTGSMAIEVLARAGVGNLIIVDPDHITESNLERVHGSQPAHVAQGMPKVLIAREHALSINAECEIKAYLAALPQKEVVDAVVTADVAIGCTDQQHSRLALSDLCTRYLVPVIDCGVMLEGAEGAVTGQIIQLVRFLSADPCALCRDMIIPQRLAQELMSEEEKAERRAAAEKAIMRGEDPDPYWQGVPQLNTVGYLTGAAGALAAAYAIGWISGRFDPPFARLQMNIVEKCFDVQEVVMSAKHQCACSRVRGWADQGAADAFISPPPHWSPAKVLA